MPTIDSIIPEITKQCIEPISEQIANRLLHVLEIDKIFKNNIFIDSDDLKASNFTGDNDKTRIQSNRCDYTIIPGYNPIDSVFEASGGMKTNTYLSMKRWTFGEYPVFKDPRSGISLYEVTVPCSIELRFSLKVKSIELSDAINTMLYSRYLVGGSVYDYNDILFSYGIPDRLILLIYKMYKMQDDVVAAMTFKEYLTVGSNAAITMLLNSTRLDGDKELIMQRNNVRVLGRLDYNGDKHSTEDINKISNRYIIEFSYFYQFAKPALLRISYPVMVNNKQIDGQFIGQPLNMEYGDVNKIHPMRAINNQYFNHNQAQIDLSLSYPCIRYPFYDDWQRSSAMYANIMNQYQPLFIGLLSVDVDADTGALSLTIDLETEIFPLLDPAVVEQIRYVVKEMNLDSTAIFTFNDVFRRLGIFDISVFSNNNMISFDRLHLDDTFKLIVDGSIYIHKTYHIVISQIREIRILNRLYVYHMLTYPDYYKDFIAFHMRYLIENEFVKVITDGITKEKTAELQQKATRPHGTNLTQRAITINNYVLEVQPYR